MKPRIDRRALLSLPFALRLRADQSLRPQIDALPILKLQRKDLRDSFEDVRGQSKHEAIDIMAPRRTPVRAVVCGIVQKLFLSKPGGNTIYLFDAAERYCYYYAHLDSYLEGLREGARVEAGEQIGYVGTSGNAHPNNPHLHMAIFELDSTKRWWKGTPLNPYPSLLHKVEEITRGR